MAILALGVFIIGGKKYLFTSTYKLHARFTNVAGLSTGADVLVGGVHVGTVDAIDLPNRAGDQVTISMQLDRSTHEIVKHDSVATIETEGMLGNQYVAVSFGSAGQADVKDGETIASLPPLEMGVLLDKANTILDSSKVAMLHIADATSSLQSVTAKIDRGDGTVGALINDREIYNDLKQTSASAQGIATSAQAGVADFQENMEALKHNFLLRGYFKARGYEDSSEIGKDEIADMPSGATLKEFTFEVKGLFATRDSAEMKNQKALNIAGESLASSGFGIAVIVVPSGSLGDTDSELLLAQARGMVIRDYLVGHYSFDDTKLKTIALAKQSGEVDKSEWGQIRIVLYPANTLIPVGKVPAATAAVVGTFRSRTSIDTGKRGFAGQSGH
jgi:phospholipid/cholesterol/gamma-HCH transport system substrate-binding protein